jgi:Pvc16 N-terminal domain
MSTIFALAGVSAQLKQLLEDGLERHGVADALRSPVSVTVLPPDRGEATGAGARLNLFLYQTAPNLRLRNVAAPVQRGADTALHYPPLALDLHYLISAYGTEELQAEALLGSALLQLHEHPVLTTGVSLSQAAAHMAHAAASAPDFDAVMAAERSGQSARLSITPTVLSIAELAALWTAMRTPCRPCITVEVSAVRIDSDAPDVRE